ncbi:alpha/beta hydrolase, partial [Pseudomonas soli]|nr:alpha/beta hydrolase [Pseudomonas soli]
MTTLSWIRGVNGTLGHLAPEHVAGKMRRAFMTPRNLPPKPSDPPLLATPDRLPLRLRSSAFRSGPRPTVLPLLGCARRPPP